MKTALWEIFVIIVIAVVLFFSKDASLNAMLIFYVYPYYLLLRLLMFFIRLLIRDYRKLKAGQGPVTSKTSVKIGMPILVVLLLWSGYDLAANIWPTATVIDAETGAPIEGAVALAQWKRTVMIIPEGGSEALAKAKESFSGKDGKVYIGGFWGLYIFSQQPSLTVYKPGYVLWNSRWLCPTSEPRTDFDGNNRTVKLLKFDIEAARWIKENYQNGDFGPHILQEIFFNSCYSRENSGEIKFYKIYKKYNEPFFEKEGLATHKKSLKE